MFDKSKKIFKCGMVSIVGRPNVGKSTLFNKILEEKVAIVSKIPQTTRNQIRGIYNDERGQIIFIDTPGLHLGKDKLDKFMNKASSNTMQEADCIIYLVDVTRLIGEEEQNVANKLKKVTRPLILGLNKIDKGDKNFAAYISFWEEVKGKSVTEMDSFMMMPLSSHKGINVDKLIDAIFDFLPEGPALYPEEIICDVPQRMAFADIIREKLFRLMRNEIPHSLGVVIEDMQPAKRKTMVIKALIIVEKDTQKEIVIGQKGQVLKKVGTLAREELEDLLEMKVFLELFVKTRKNWREDISLLQEQGYD